jgi:hypothetical protein
MKIRYFFCLAFCFIFSSCNKNKNQHPVPSIPLDISININLPSYINLTGVGGYAFVSGGSKGIIVYRKSIDEFVAFDRHSPNDIDGVCLPLEPDSSNYLMLLDACSEGVYSLLDGSPISNSDWGLRQYQCLWDGNTYLRIRN